MGFSKESKTIREIERSFCTVGQAAEAIGVTRQRLHVILLEHKVEYFQIHKRLYLIPRSEVKRVIAERKQNSRIANREAKPGGEGVSR